MRYSVVGNRLRVRSVTIRFAKAIATSPLCSVIWAYTSCSGLAYLEAAGAALQGYPYGLILASIWLGSFLDYS
jgi:hypothetical protein